MLVVIAELTRTVYRAIFIGIRISQMVYAVFYEIKYQRKSCDKTDLSGDQLLTAGRLALRLTCTQSNLNRYW
jgi:hypothetical protein